MTQSLPVGTVFVGDSAYALQQLAEQDTSVDVVYIDPPYNTGNTFTHYDDGMEHDQWLDMMRTRLQLCHTLLADTGSLWVHVDDSEMAYCRILLDEIFGRSNFLSQIVVEINPKGRQLGKFFAGCHDYIVVFAKNIDQVSLDPATTDLVNKKDFPLTDEHGVAYRRLPLRNTNKKFNPASAPTMTYTLFADPDTGRVDVAEFSGSTAVQPVFGDLSDAVWRWSKDTAATRLAELEARIVRGKKGQRVDVFQRDYLHEGRTKKMRTIWHAAEVGSSDSAKIEIKNLFTDRECFSTPKPEALLHRIISSTTQPGDTVLDCFAGSGTTAAVAHKMGRNWIAVEKNSDTAERFLIPRIERIIEGSDPGGCTEKTGWKNGGNFSVIA